MVKADTTTMIVNPELKTQAEDAPFWSEQNQKLLTATIRRIKNGQARSMI